MLQRGESGVVKSIHGKPKDIHHLADLGLVVGATVKAVNEVAGNLIIEVKGSRLAMNKVMANRIILEV
ncbi:FeoA domain protein [Veillonellaceae bacterium DNF00751]|jgi:hypothetical protein|uniref:FeoA domain protein n=2 Tax=Megasphaera lornae TaxID=1000568 RepID=D3LT79_9FIRM|nr:FeoA domain protein [Megasphaera genomosp. type_1 str. 28L]EGL42384.1 FeoA domain protein [Megasphaera lornae]KXB92466.1 FeoA domain protein [Veillonellaceae bacterium DNF00751]MUP50298.1 ferrous iron transport protein A [Veillonellaceae bacterium M1-70]